MNAIRKIVVWLTLLWIIMMALLSVAAAFMGTDKITETSWQMRLFEDLPKWLQPVLRPFLTQSAPEFFNSVPLGIVWALLAVMLLIAPFFYMKVRRPAGLAIHLGPLLVIIGGIWGGHWMHNYLHERDPNSRIYSGRMVLREGRDSTDDVIYRLDQHQQLMSRVPNPRLDSDYVAYALPFKVHLEDFEISYYEPGRWDLLYARPILQANHQINPNYVVLNWERRGVVDIPGSPLKLRVTEYLPDGAAGAAGQVGGRLIVWDAGGKQHVLPAKVGEKLELTDPKATVEITRVLQRLQVQDGQVVDRPGGELNQAVEVMVKKPDEPEPQRRYIGPNFGMHGRATPRMEYLPPPDLAGRPTMKFTLIAPSGQSEHQFVPRGPQAADFFSLKGYLKAPASDAHGHDLTPYLAFVQPNRAPKDYVSQLQIVQDGQVVADKPVEVNYPLHYGGYHIYQSAYMDDRTPIFRFVSDRGLWLVWIGFIVALAGVFWGMWIRPAWRYCFARTSKAD